MKTLTVNQLMKLNPCEDYPRERVEKLWRDRKMLGVDEISRLRIPADDRVWACIHCLNKRERQVFADAVADRAVEKWALKCGIPELEMWAAAWLSGEDRSESAAESAARSARSAWGAARSARSAWSAWSAARSAWSAWSAAEGAEHSWQLKLLRKMAAGK